MAHAQLAQKRLENMQVQDWSGRPWLGNLVPEEKWIITSLGREVNGNPDVSCRTDYNFADKCRHACIVSRRGSTPALPFSHQACSHVGMLVWWHVGKLARWQLDMAACWHGGMAARRHVGMVAWQHGGMVTS